MPGYPGIYRDEGVQKKYLCQVIFEYGIIN